MSCRCMTCPNIGSSLSNMVYPYIFRYGIAKHIHVKYYKHVSVLVDYYVNGFPREESRIWVEIRHVLTYNFIDILVLRLFNFETFIKD